MKLTQMLLLLELLVRERGGERLDQHEDGAAQPHPLEVARQDEDLRVLEGEVAVAPHKEGDDRVDGQEGRRVGEVVLHGEAREVLRAEGRRR